MFRPLRVPEQESLWLVLAVAAACAVPGVFLVLRRLALIGDAMSHVLLFGIVAAYFVVRDLDSPWLLVGAAASALLTVALVALLQRARLVKEDAAIGLVFPALFSLGTLVASMNFRDTHLDVDQVLLGHAELAGETRPAYLGGVYVGRVPTLLMGALFAANALLAALFYKELKLTTFDAALAVGLGFLPGVVHYALMTSVAVTTVAAFDAVGPVLVVAFLVVPAATARLLTARLGVMLVLSVLIGVVASVIGVRAAYLAGANVAGMVASVLGLGFGAAFVASPRHGLLAAAFRRVRQRRDFAETLLVLRLADRPGDLPDAPKGVAERALRRGLVTRDGARLILTPAGQARAAGPFGRTAGLPATAGE